jgi:hypothetical protein
MPSALAPRGYSAFGTAVAGTDAAGTIKLAAFFAEIIELGELTESRGAIDTTNSATTGGKATYVPEDIIEGGEYSITVLHDPMLDPPFGAPEVIVITYPMRGTAAVAAKRTFSGFLLEHVTTFPLKGSPGMVTKCKLKVSGPITYADPT